MRHLLAAALLTAPAMLQAHGPGHIHAPGGEEPPPGQPGSVASAPSKCLAPLEEERWWGASLAAAWESRHVHYGVDETGLTGAFTTELSLRMHNFVFSVWSGLGTGSDFQEWDFTASYVWDAGAVFLIPGFNFRYTPSFAFESHDHSHHEHGHDEEHGHHEDHAGPSAHDDHEHNVYGYEIFLILGTDKIPHVTPTVMVLSDLANTPGTLLQFRLDGELPLPWRALALRPYSLLAVNLGYNGNDTMGWNNFQFGAEAEWRVNQHVSLFGHVNYSLAMDALREIGQDNVFWAGGGVRLAY